MMTPRIRISAGDISLTASLNSSATAEAIWDALPLEGGVNTWGDEIYFAIPVEIEEADEARQDMGIGELGFWPAGNAFCIFFGPTPASEGSEPRAYSNVNPFGMIEGDATVLKALRGGERAMVERCDE
jgi:hypothetical protein